jgi:putative hydrolase
VHAPILSSSASLGSDGVSDIPFGFRPPSDGDDESSGSGSSSGGSSGSGSSGGSDPAPPSSGAGGEDPFAAMFGQLGMGNMGSADLGAAFQQIGRLLSWTGGPVNWDLARDLARQGVAASKDSSILALERDQVREAVRLAELWLGTATDLPAGTSDALAWSRAEWVEQTLPVWQQLIDPVAARVVEAMGKALAEQTPPEGAGELAGMGGALAGQMSGLMASLGGAMFGAQVGQALASLAGEVVGSTDIGIPLAPSGRAVLLPAGVAAFGEGLGVPEEEVRLYLALREAAHHRLFAHVPWLRARLMADVESYASGITIDTARIEEALSGVDPMNPQSMQDAFSTGMFEPQTTPGQEHALRRLETLLALVEGWVDEVVDAAAGPRLPSAAALRETVRRRRAAGGPAEQTFASLVGLELRPRRLREAAALWAALREARGADGRDAVWGHPDLMPDSDDLDDPGAFARRSTEELDISAMEPPAEDGPAGTPAS